MSTLILGFLAVQHFLAALPVVTVATDSTLLLVVGAHNRLNQLLLYLSTVVVVEVGINHCEFYAQHPSIHLNQSINQSNMVGY